MKIKKLISKFLVAAMLISAVPMNSIAEGEQVYFENQENAESAYDGAGEWAEALTDDVVVIDQEAASEKAEIPEEEGDASVVEIVEAADPEIPAAEETPAANEIPAEEGPAEEEVPAIEKAADETSVKEDAPAADKTPAVEAAPDSEKAATDEWGRTDEWAEPAGEADGLAAAEAVEGEIAEAAEGNAESMGSADGPEADNSIENAAEVSALTLAGGGTPVAQIGETTYESLGAAIAAVPENEETTITILCDIPDAVGITVDGAKEFTVDFGGHVYTVGKPGAGSAGTKTQGFQLLKDTRVTFKNGTIQVDPENKNVVWAADAREKGIAWLINNYGILCLDNMTIDGTNLAKNLQSAGGQEPANVVRYVVNNYANGVYITGNTEITAAEGDVALSANAYNAFYEKPEYSGGLSAVIESATINGKVESIGSWLDLRSGAVVNGQLRVGQNKEGAKGRSNVAIYKGATVSNPEYPVVVFGKNTLDVYGKVESTSADSRDTAAISTNGNAYNAGSVINIHDGADISSKTCSAIYLPNGSLTIDGGEITGPTAVYFKSTALSISGGTLTGNGEKAEYKYNGNGNNPTGDALVIDNCNYPTPLAESPVQVTGGRFVSENACPVGSYAGNGQETPLQKFISGGNFNAAFAEGTNLLKEGFKLELNGYGTYSVVSEEAAYQIVETEKTYQSLSAAIAEVGEGQTIKLLRNVADAEGITIPENSKFTVDFDGHVYTTGCPGAGSARTRTQAFQILEGSNITFKNGTIKCSEENKDYTWSKDSENKGIAMLIQNYADLTLSYMVIDGTNIAHNGSNVRYVMSNNSGTVNIKDTQIKAPEGDFALDSCLYHTYKKPVVTIESSFARITGNIEATGGDININASVDGQVRVGQNKAGGAAGSVVTIGENAYVMRNEYPVVVFGENTLNVYGNVFSESSTSKDTAAISTNGNAYNAGSVINIYDGAQVSSETCSAIYMPNGELNICGGYITGPTAVYFKSTALSISGGTLTGNGEKAEYKYNGNGGNPTGDALVIDNCNYPSGITAPVITGGEFISEKASPVGSYAGNGQTESLTHFVSGGTFKTPIEPSADLCAEGYKFVKNAEGKYGVESTYEARIGEEKYATLAAAVAEAKDGDTIVLLSNVKLSEQLCTGTKKFTLDLNGKEITYVGTTTLGRGLIGVNNGGDLTINDSSTSSTGAIKSGTNAYAAVAMTVPGDTDTNVAKLTLESGTLEGYYYGIVGNGDRGNTSVTVTGGSVIATNKDDSVGIYNPQAGSLTITGGTVEGAMGIYVKAGNPIEIKGGTVIGNGAKGEYTPTGDGTKNTGDALVVDNCGYPGGVPGVSVEGGTFRSINGSAVASYAKTGYNPVVGFISGGAFETKIKPSGELCAEGFEFVENGDGTYSVENKYEAKIGDKMYAALGDAVTAARDGDTIILLSDIELEAQLCTGSKRFTLDLNGKEITYIGTTTLGRGLIGVNNGGDLTIKDSSDPSTGAIRLGENAYGAVAMTVPDDTDTNVAKLTLESGTLEGYYYGIVGNGKRGNTSVMVTGGSVAGTKKDDSVGIYNPQAGSLTVTGGTVEGAMGIYVKAGNPIEITGGTIIGNGAKGDYVPDGDGTKNTGDALVVDNCGYPGGVPGVSVKDGTFRSINGNAVASYAKPGTSFEPVKGFVSGGTFETPIEPSADLCAEGFAFVKNADGTYGVEAVEYVAKVGDSFFTTLSDAVAAAKGTGKELHVIADLTEPSLNLLPASNGYKLVVDPGVTLQLGTDAGKGITYSASGKSGETFVNNGTVILTGNFVGTAGNCTFVNNGIIVSKSTTSSSFSAKGGAGGTNNGTIESMGTIEIKGTSFVNNGTVTGAEGKNLKITDGSTSGSRPLAMGTYIWKDGTWKTYMDLVDGSGNVVASYASPKDAASKFQPGYVIRMTADYTETSAWTVTKAVVLDLNGYTIANETTDKTISITGSGSLTVFDNSSEKTGKIENTMTDSSAAVYIQDTAAFILESGTVSGAVYGISGNGSDAGQNTTVTINGGTVNGGEVGIYGPQKGILTVAGGEISGKTAVYLKSGTLNVSDGFLNGTGESSDYVYMKNGCKPTGDGLVVDNCGYPGGVPIVSVTGGTINSANAAPIGSYIGVEKTKAVTQFVSGGTYNKVFNEILCVRGYQLKENSEGTYDVVEGDPVARIERTETEYSSLEAAIAAAIEGDMITLLDDIVGIGIIIPAGKDFTIDFANHTYTATPPAAGSKGTESQAFQLLPGSEIVFENGTINCSAYNAVAPMTAWPIQIIIQNYATLTLDHMTIDGTNIAHYDEEHNSCLVSTNNGTTTIIGGSIITDPSRLVRDVAFDSYKYGEPYSVPTVTVDGVEIDGAVEIDGGIANVKGNTTVTGRVDIYNDGQLSVENGVFSNLIWVGDDEDHLTITGGRFAMIDAPTSASVPKYVTITGGLFKRQIMKEWGWMPDGYDCYPGTEAQYPYMVTKTKSEEAAVKTTAGVVSFYQTVEEAIETVSKGTSEYDKGATILLLKDAAIENPSGVSFMKESIFDLGGNMLTVTNSDGVGNIQIHENVTVRNGYITASPFSVDTFAYSIFEIQKEGMTITLQNIGLKAYSPISLARDNAKLVIEDTDDSEIRSNYQVHTLAAARSNGSSIWIKSGDYDIRSWVFDKDDEHNACTVRIDGGNFIIGSWNGKGVGLPTGYDVAISAGAFNLVPDEDFVVIPEGSYAVVDNAAETYKCTVGPSKSTAEASVKAQHLVNTDLYYKNLDYAMDVAYKAEDTGRKAVKLANNFAHESKGYLVPAGVTLDLAGYTLGCDSYSSNTGAYTMDSTAGTGAINAALVTIDALNNGYMAIKDPAKGYRFFPYAMRKGNPKVPDSSKPNRIRIQYAIDIKNTTGAIDHYSDAYKLLAAGNTACGLTFVTDVAFRGKTYQFKYETTDTMKVYGTDQSENPLNTKAISAYFNVNALKTGDVFNADATVQGDTQFSYTQKYAKTF